MKKNKKICNSECLKGFENKKCKKEWFVFDKEDKEMSVMLFVGLFVCFMNDV